MRISTLLSYAGGFKEAVKEVAAAGESRSGHGLGTGGLFLRCAQRDGLSGCQHGNRDHRFRHPADLLTHAQSAGHDRSGYRLPFRRPLPARAWAPPVPRSSKDFHGVPYQAPVGRMREIIEICRTVWRRETLKHDGRLLPDAAVTGRRYRARQSPEADQSPGPGRHSDRHCRARQLKVWK